MSWPRVGTQGAGAQGALLLSPLDGRGPCAWAAGATWSLGWLLSSCRRQLCQASASLSAETLSHQLISAPSCHESDSKDLTCLQRPPLLQALRTNRPTLETTPTTEKTTALPARGEAAPVRAQPGNHPFRARKNRTTLKDSVTGLLLLFSNNIKKISRVLRVSTQMKKTSVYRRLPTLLWPQWAVSAETPPIPIQVPCSLHPCHLPHSPCHLPNPEGQDSTKETHTHCVCAVSFIDSVKATANLVK